MDHKGIVEKVVEIESRYDVNSVLCKDIKIWPIIRHFILSGLLHPSKERNGVCHGSAKPREGLGSFGHRVIFFFKSCRA